MFIKLTDLDATFSLPTVYDGSVCLIVQSNVVCKY